jgi:hypothetical protein
LVVGKTVDSRGFWFRKERQDIGFSPVPLELGALANDQRRTTNDALQIRFPEKTMSAPSRRPEIRRRRTRKEKVVKLLKRLNAAGSETDRSRLSAKLARLARTSPGQPLVKS